MSVITKVSGTNINLTSSGTAALSAIVGATRVRIAATAAVYVRFGTAPVADNTDLVIPAGHVETFGGLALTDKVSVVQVTAGGIVSITPIR